MTRVEFKERSIKRGEVYYVHRYSTVGSEQQAGRPAVIVSSNTLNYRSPVYEICFLTLQPKASRTVHVPILTGECSGSTILCEQVTTVAYERIGDKMCDLPEEIMEQVNEALINSLGIDFLATEETTFEIDAMRAETEKLIEERNRYKQMYEDLLDRIMRR